MGKTFFIVYSVVLVLLMAYILFTPIAAFSNPPSVQGAYDAGAYACHQKISRSYCIFNSSTGYYISDCIEQTGTYLSGDSKFLTVKSTNGDIGYKMPVCSRDVGIYLAMLVGGLVYPFFRKLDSKEMPSIAYLILAIAPLALDGTLQLISNMGFQLPVLGFYESTNFIRLITGLIAGFVLPFYIFPMASMLTGGKTTKVQKPQ
jgi:uncharacterized membrane protein